MTKIFLAIVVLVSKIVGISEKPLKQKILLLILTYIVAYPVLMHLPDAVWAKNNRPMAALILAGFVLGTATFTHLLAFHPNKEIRLKFWKRQNPDNE